MADGDENLPAEKPAEKRRRGNYSISPRLAKTLMLLASGECKTQVVACQQGGMTPKALQQALKRPNVQKYMVENIQGTLAISATRAATKMRELLDSDNGMVAFRASAYSLATGAGIAPADQRGPMVAINLGVSPGYVIDVAPGDDGQTIDNHVMPIRPLKDITLANRGDEGDC